MAQVSRAQARYERYGTRGALRGDQTRKLRPCCWWPRTHPGVKANDASGRTLAYPARSSTALRAFMVFSVVTSICSIRIRSAPAKSGLPDPGCSRISATQRSNSAMRSFSRLSSSAFPTMTNTMTENCSFRIDQAQLAWLQSTKPSQAATRTPRRSAGASRRLNRARRFFVSRHCLAPPMKLRCEGDRPPQ